MLTLGCDAVTENSAEWIPLVDSVYECSTADGPIEVCFDGSEVGLETRINADCWPTSRHIGWCFHECPTPESGCNASHGCYCG
jgi:hypothetical protein